MEGFQMSATFGLALAVLTLGSCYASYRLGQADILARYRRHDERRRRWREFEDFED
jgi:hypothetical protein